MHQQGWRSPSTSLNHISNQLHQQCPEPLCVNFTESYQIGQRNKKEKLLNTENNEMKVNAEFLENFYRCKREANKIN